MADLDRIRVLIVENEGLVGCDLASTLGQLGYVVAGLYPSGEEALQAADDLRPDVVLMDVHLGGELDGIETARLLAQRSPVAVIYLTACSDAETVARAKETHPCGYLLKPFNEQELRAALEVAAARHRADQKRQGREHTFFHAFQSMADAVIGSDLAGQVIFVNPAAERVLGWSSDDAVGQSLGDIYAVRNIDGEPVILLPSAQKGQTEHRELVLTSKGGERLRIEDRVAPVRDGRGSIGGLIIVFRQLPETAPEGEPPPAGRTGPVAATSTPLVDIVESISDPLVALDSQWRFTYVNGSAAKLFRRDKRVLLGQPLWEVLPPSVQQSHKEALSKAMLHRESITSEVFLEEVNAWHEARTYPFGNGMLLLLKDITTRKIEAERSSRLDRLESLGLLARGFAHDFNNLLTVLLGNLALAEMRLGSQSEKSGEITTAKQATLQAQNLVQQLLTFARGGAPIKRHVSLSELVKAFFEHHARVPNVHYFVEVQEDLPQVAVDPNQIRRLLGNLVRNAEQATVRGGEIHVRCEAATENEMFPHEIVADSPSELAGVTLEVRDTGEGIASEHLPRVFEPYFTTRKAENATGLGLTVCESIAKGHGGNLSVNSQRGQGTRVRFFIPVDADADEADGLALGNAFMPSPNTNVRVLVLEDDHLVRALVVRGLQTQGYEVIETTDGTDTVRLYQQALTDSRPFDLVVLDLSIPNGMGGLRTMEKLRQIDPNVLAMVSSGYSDDPVMAQPAAYGFAAVLPKPYEPVELIRLVKNLLASRVKPEV
jgi:PAS domain S-box-containing protein